MRQSFSTRQRTVLLLLVIDASAIAYAVAQSPGLLFPENRRMNIFTLSVNAGDSFNPLLEYGPGIPKTMSSGYSTPQIPSVRSSIEVKASRETLDTGLTVPYHVKREEILSSAGTWGDFSRYLQMMPGVVWNTDISNDVMVRGGNPAENLYVIDGIEVPNINHIALEGTTGGFTSMIDTSSIESIDMKTGIYGAQYSNRLSSLIDIHTRSLTKAEGTGEFTFGISGIGGVLQRPLSNHGTAFFAGHRSILNLVTDDIGINGVPIYTDGMSRFEWTPNNRDQISILTLDGGDSIDITPDACDPGVTLNVRTAYGGLRSTTGMVWQHMHGAKALSRLVASYSSQQQDIGQQLQAPGNNQSRQTCMHTAVKLTSVYREKARDGIGSLAYGFQSGSRNWFYAAGATARINHINYAVNQPKGQQSPFNTSATWTDATTFDRNFSSGQGAAYVELTGHLGTRWAMTSGIREEVYALTSAHMLSPRGSMAFRVNAHQTLNASVSQSAQLAPAMNIVSYLANQQLRPIKVRQLSLGADIWRGGAATLSVEAYQKHYTDEPVSTEYPSLMLANMVDTLGQQFVWLPLKTGGYGTARGVELLLRAHALSRLQMLGAVAYSHTRYAAADGILRRGNFDFPLIANSTATIRLNKIFTISVRDTYATGRPYTPFNITISEQQSRGIYDLTKINALRGSAYNRIDADLHFVLHIAGKPMRVYGGLENALDRENFLGYAWMDSCHPKAGATVCGPNVNAITGVPETKVTQMPRFPSAGMQYSF
jgi:hypothetical protein